MINFLMAVVVGIVIGAIGGFALRGRNRDAIWLAPVFAVAGALLASIAARLVSDDGGDYGRKELALQVVLAIVGFGIVPLLRPRSGPPSTA